MTASAFLDRSSSPSDRQLAGVLGPAALARWQALCGGVGERFAGTTAEWAFSGKAHGWSLRLQLCKRPILYLTPLEGCFRASFALRESVWQVALAGDLPEAVRAAMAEAPAYPEGRAVRLPVGRDDDVDLVLSLVALRMSG